MITALLLLACCIDSPAWTNPREGGRPPISCEDVTGGKLGWSVGGGFSSCDARKVDDHWEYQGSNKGGGTYSFEMMDEQRLNQAREDARQADEPEGAPVGPAIDLRDAEVAQ